MFLHIFIDLLVCTSLAFGLSLTVELYKCPKYCSRGPVTECIPERVLQSAFSSKLPTLPANLACRFFDISERKYKKKHSTPELAPMFTKFLALFAVCVFASETWVVGLPPPTNFRPICTPESAIAVAINNTNIFIEQVAVNPAQVSEEYGAAPIAFVDPNYCFIPGCCTRFQPLSQYITEQWFGPVVTFLNNGPVQATYNPDGSVTVYSTEVRYTADTILSVRSVFWVWAPVENLQCLQDPVCQMHLVQFQSSDYTCQFGAPPCGNCYTGDL